MSQEIVDVLKKWHLENNLFTGAEIFAGSNEDYLSVACQNSEGKYFDIASCTKVLTEASILMLVFLKQMSLSGKVSKYLPKTNGTELGGITIYDLINFNLEFVLPNPEYQWGDMFTCPIKKGKFRYSDIPYNILGEILKNYVDAGSLESSLKLVLGANGFPEIEYFYFSPDIYHKRKNLKCAPTFGDGKYCGIVHNKKNRDWDFKSTGSAGIFARASDMYVLGRFLVDSSFGRFFWENRVKTDEQLSLPLGRAGSFCFRNGKFTGNKEFDRKHFVAMGFTGPTLFVEPESKFVAAIMTNSSISLSRPYLGPDERDEYKSKNYNFRLEVISAILDYFKMC